MNLELIDKLKAYKPLNADEFTFIVRAVNCHEEMYETLKAIAEGRYAEGEEQEMARKAIAKAERR